ncbi:hypothetical protein GCM10011487_26630 [Steroidobacter agaridevorans]|uniref:Uncharacterized protein n=1 Tax=Steroidobacter agaridevorans TaxID=2695856 RepID=A0A829YCI4_9GAMM|nr:hypothetical protein GCM10011487_26630 [Steroidobacter agaridevorans]
MIIVALCYGELGARSPTAGSEFIYTLETFGPFPEFLVGWFLTFAHISVCAFEARVAGANALSWGVDRGEEATLFVPAATRVIPGFAGNSLKRAAEMAANTRLSGRSRSEEMTVGAVFGYTGALPKRPYR